MRASGVQFVATDVDGIVMPEARVLDDVTSTYSEAQCFAGLEESARRQNLDLDADDFTRLHLLGPVVTQIRPPRLGSFRVQVTLRSPVLDRKSVV